MTRSPRCSTTSAQRDIQQNFKSQGLGIGPDGPGVNEPVPYDGRDDHPRQVQRPARQGSTTYDGGIWAAGWIAQEDRGILLLQARYDRLCGGDRHPEHHRDTA